MKGRPHRADFARQLAVLGFSACVPSCASAGPTFSRPAAAPATAATFSEPTGAMPRYHSKRLGLSVPLPDGHAWHIDDHSRAALIAIHAATHSKLAIAILRAATLVGRTECENMAREQRIVSDEERSTTVEDEVLSTQSFDTRVRVAFAPSSQPNGPIVGHVMAFGGALRKCFAFDYSTQVDSAADEAALSSRLAFARTRIFAGLDFDSIQTLARPLPARSPGASDH